MLENLIDKEAIEKALWLRSYCIKHGNRCINCVFFDEKNKDVFNNETCILKRSVPDLWLKTYKEIDL